MDEAIGCEQWQTSEGWLNHCRWLAGMWARAPDSTGRLRSVYPKHTSTRVVRSGTVGFCALGSAPHVRGRFEVEPELVGVNATADASGWRFCVVWPAGADVRQQPPVPRGLCRVARMAQPPEVSERIGAQQDSAVVSSDRDAQGDLVVYLLGVAAAQRSGRLIDEWRALPALKALCGRERLYAPGMPFATRSRGATAPAALSAGRSGAQLTNSLRPTRGDSGACMRRPL